ncbi:hypothetical protein E3J62_07830 [candidate division TA06 bacterium]|uniref:Putative zinc-finger domain-containing protein n=1 Tax=candidate division TA06 bacterium TaxID=2250710 RepID=A0A523USF3_UNCT6|nr:MAG: hypothetical protein E3J62_07830 [candidate division TA06 bacterium]
MDHSQVRKLLSAYMDGELDLSSTEMLREHINQCEACTRYLESFHALDKSVRSAKPEMPAEGYFEFFPQKLRARIRSEGKAPVRIGRLEVRLARIRIGTTAIVVLMAFGIGFLYGQREIIVPMPKLTPIPVVSELAPEAPLLEAADEVTSTAKLTSRAEEKVANGSSIAGALEKEERGAEPPAAGLVGVRAKRFESVAKDRAVEAPAETPVRAYRPDGLRLSRKADKKGSPELTPATRYAQANVAQLDGDYSSAMDDYARVLKDSPGTDLASAAQYQMNMITAGPDTTASIETLEMAASIWKDYISQYPESRLIRPACGLYTENLYLIARRTKSRSDATKALSAIKECSGLIKEKMPSDFKERSEELKSYLKG